MSPTKILSRVAAVGATMVALGMNEGREEPMVGSLELYSWIFGNLRLAQSLFQLLGGHLEVMQSCLQCNIVLVK